MRSWPTASRCRLAQWTCRRRHGRSTSSNGAARRGGRRPRRAMSLRDVAQLALDPGLTSTPPSPSPHDGSWWTRWRRASAARWRGLGWCPRASSRTSPVAPSIQAPPCRPPCVPLATVCSSSGTATHAAEPSSPGGRGAVARVPRRGLATFHSRASTSGAALHPAPDPAAAPPRPHHPLLPCPRPPHRRRVSEVEPHSSARARRRAGGSGSTAGPPRLSRARPVEPRQTVETSAEPHPSQMGRLDEAPVDVPFVPSPPSGVPWAIAGGGLLTIAIISSQLGGTRAGIALVPLAAVLLAVATARRVARIHPDEAWIGRWLMLGVVVKPTASYLRYHTLVDSYRGAGTPRGTTPTAASSWRPGWVTARNPCCPTSGVPTSSVGSPEPSTTCSART